MPQLSTNLQLIKQVAFIIYFIFYELDGEIYVFFPPLFPVCRYTVKLSKWLMHLVLRQALDYTFFL